MMVLRHPRLGRRHLPLEVAANSGQIALLVATTTQVGATSLLQTARYVPEPLMPVPLRHRAMVMRQHQCRLLQRHHHLGRHLHSLRFIATRTQRRHSCVQVAVYAPIVVAMLVCAHDAWGISVASSSCTLATRAIASGTIAAGACSAAIQGEELLGCRVLELQDRRN